MYLLKSEDFVVFFFNKFVMQYFDKNRVKKHTVVMVECLG